MPWASHTHTHTHTQTQGISTSASDEYLMMPTALFCAALDRGSSVVIPGKQCMIVSHSLKKHRFRCVIVFHQRNNEQLRPQLPIIVSSCHSVQCPVTRFLGPCVSDFGRGPPLRTHSEYTRTQSRTGTRTHTQTHTRTRTHTHTNTHTGTRTHTHTHTLRDCR